MACRRVASTILLALLATSILVAITLPSGPLAVVASKARAGTGLRAPGTSLGRGEQAAEPPAPPFPEEGLLYDRFPHPPGRPWLEERREALIEPEPKPLTPSPGDWVVTGTEVREDETIILTGNLIIQPGGNLTLINCTLYMNCTYDGEWQILVNSLGTFNVLEGSVITAYNASYEFLFYVYGRLIMEDSELHECGYDWAHPGLWLGTDEGVVIKNCRISRNGHGICCWYSSGITIMNCTISQNEDCGIYCGYSSSITIQGCAISQNEDYGIYCYGSSDITIKGNVFIRDGVVLWGGEPRHFASHTIEDNTVNGKPLYYIVNITGPYEVPSDAGQAIIVNSTQISLTGMNLSYADIGLRIVYSEDIQVKSSIMSQNWCGIYCYDSSGITIQDCTISQNRHGIYCYDSSGTTIQECTISRNALGIHCRHSSGITIQGCAINQSRDDGIYCYNSSGITIQDCMIGQNRYDGICCEEASNITIMNCTMSQNGDYGIYCLWAANVSIHFCNIFGNEGHGLYVRGTYVVNATYNWWNSTIGPEYKARGDPEDPEEVYSVDGQEYVLYEPWLTEPAEVDITLLSVSITAPAGGSYVRGVVIVKANASDNVDRVEFYVDGALVFTDTEAPYEFEWNTMAWLDGEHTIRAVAYDLAGNRAEESISVVVDNTPPVISSVQHEPKEPSPGQEVAVTASVLDGTSGLERVALYYRVDGGDWQSVEMTEQAGAWVASIPGQEEGAEVEYYVEARDRAGNMARSDTHAYTVKAAQQAPGGGGGWPGGRPTLPSEVFGLPLITIISLLSLVVALIALAAAIKTRRRPAMHLSPG